MNAAQTAEKWGISDRRVRTLCQQGKIDGVIRQGRSYLIPAKAAKPIDGRWLRRKPAPERRAGEFWGPPGEDGQNNSP